MGESRKPSWLEQRTGAAAASRHFMTETIPASTGWRNTFGSLAGALLLFQVLTGFLLALYYVPHPEAAYESVGYIERELTLGWFMRALHYWGASFIVIALFLHIVRVFWSGAYRPPRELTWIVGVILLGVTLTLAFTGQLLPYNQMGYWAANVGVEIAASTPVIGARVRDLLLGG
ncbi:MAG: cytochrome b N-terminal domain-containing protein, partial [Candidatus Hydrogenedentales bacterium]